MTNTFEKIPEEKRNLIITLSVEEFSLKSYADASTDDIARKAGIAKGSLFYYFKSKKGLYLYVLGDCITRALAAAKKRSVDTDDAREGLIDSFYNRIKFCRENPETFRLIQRASGELSPEVFEEKQQLMNAYIDDSDRELKDSISSFVKKASLNTDPVTACDVLYMYWTGVSMFMLNRHKQLPERAMREPETVYTDIETYFNTLFDGLFKPKK